MALNVNRYLTAHVCDMPYASYNELILQMIKTDILLIIVPNVTQASVSSAEPGLD